MIPRDHPQNFIGETMSGTHHTSPRRGLTRLATLGPVAIVGGLLLGLQRVGSMCGSVFHEDNRSATYFDEIGGTGAAATCNRYIALASVPTWALIVLGIILVLTVMIIRVLGHDRPMSVTGARFRWRRRRPDARHGGVPNRAGGQIPAGPFI
jgi:hypothetical protein